MTDDMRRNMPAREVPMYHCMPDDRGAMATPPWSNKDFLLENMKKNVSYNERCMARTSCRVSENQELEAFRLLLHCCKNIVLMVLHRLVWSRRTETGTKWRFFRNAFFNVRADDDALSVDEVARPTAVRT